MSTPIADFQRYQLAFTAHLRDPLHHAPPAGVPSARMAVYDEIVFNNLQASVSACFPVACAVLGKRPWRTLNQAFMRDYSANSPLFRDIPEQFLRFLQTYDCLKHNLPPYLYALCHYEWIELYVSALPHNVEVQLPTAQMDLTSHVPIFNPTMQLLQYDYAVHQISARKKPKHSLETQLIVYRNAKHAVKFVEINAVTYQLITLIQAQNLTGAQALRLLAQQLEHPQPEVILQFGLSILHELKTQEIVVGVQPT